MTKQMLLRIFLPETLLVGTEAIYMMEQAAWCSLVVQRLLMRYKEKNKLAEIRVITGAGTQ